MPLGLGIGLFVDTGSLSSSSTPPTSFILTEAVAADKVLLETVAVSKLGLEQP